MVLGVRLGGSLALPREGRGFLCSGPGETLSGLSIQRGHGQQDGFVAKSDFSGRFRVCFVGRGSCRDGDCRRAGGQYRLADGIDVWFHCRIVVCCEAGAIGMCWQ